MAGFADDGDDTRKAVPIPRDFFDRLLPSMGNLLELKLVLHVHALIADQRGEVRCVSRRELLADGTVMRGMKLEGNPRAPADNLLDAVERAVSRGALLSATVRGESDEDVWLFLNNAEGRAALALLSEGDEGEKRDQPDRSPTQRRRVTVDRPNVFLLYEQNVGLLTPIVAELIREALSAYPETWIRDAISVSVQANKRNWRYIQRVLDRWAREGKDDGATGPFSQRSNGAVRGRRGGYERFVQS